MSFWRDKRVLLTGGNGFLGSHVRERIAREEPAALLTPRRTEIDLRDPLAIRDFLARERPNLIVHGAAVVAGIGGNRLHPGLFFYENAIMGIQLIEAARVAGIEKFVCLGTICSYPRDTPVPFREEALWDGYPEETNAPYGVAKKMLLVQLQGYRAEYGMRGIMVMPVNLYGPRDNFDLTTSHVIPAMIRKFSEAREQGLREVVLWGDGTPTREFLFVEDAAEGIVTAAERYDDPEPVNLGTGVDITVADLAKKIAALTGYDGAIVWDPSRPNGQPRRRLDVSKARERFGFVARVGLDEGLRRTVEWFRSSK